MTSDYSSVPGLTDVYLEDSYVTAIRETGDSLTFDLEAVLLPSHPAYTPARSGEQYCYASAVLTFDRIDTVEWIRRIPSRSVDADGLDDLGNIDVLIRSGNTFRVAGDWGDLTVRTETEPRFAILAVG